MLGVVPILILPYEVGVYTCLYLSLNLISLLLRICIGAPLHLVP